MVWQKNGCFRAGFDSRLSSQIEMEKHTILWKWFDESFVVKSSNKPSCEAPMKATKLNTEFQEKINVFLEGNPFQMNDILLNSILGF
jgi:hypothetical protein